MNTAQSMAEGHVILRGVVGSTAHGLSVAEQDDRDEMGICVEPWEHFFGLRSRFEPWTHRTKPEGVRSGPGDLDLVIYSLAKWARLALQGNPTVITLLFLPDSLIVHDSPPGRELRSLASAIVSDAVFARYLGYMRQQRGRMTEKRKMPKRPELVERYGFDTKYAGHVLRLGYQGIEIAETGKLTLPMDPLTAGHIIAVRTGRFTEAEVLAEAMDLETRLLDLEKKKPLGPGNPKLVEQFVLSTYMAQHTPDDLIPHHKFATSSGGGKSQ